jgi:hypothetical protein
VLAEREKGTMKNFLFSTLKIINSQGMKVNQIITGTAFGQLYRLLNPLNGILMI